VDGRRRGRGDGGGVEAKETLRRGESRLHDDEDEDAQSIIKNRTAALGMSSTGLFSILLFLLLL
jgi:hypothetical protein